MKYGKGLIFLHEKFSTERYITDRYYHVLSAISSLTNWQIVLDNSLNGAEVPSDLDYLFLVKIPQGEDIDCVVNIDKLPSYIKLISYFADIHPKGDMETQKRYLTRMEEVLSRSNLILCAYQDSFRARWSQYCKKTKWFPHCSAPTSRFKEARFLSETPKENKCLITGSIDRNYYPERHAIVQTHKDLLEVVGHPGYHMDIQFMVASGAPLRQNYASLLSRYICSLATCSMFNYPIAKYFEIPAAGTLLMANKCVDIDNLGFKDGVHYVSVDNTNFRCVMNDIISRPDYYQTIQKQGTTFIDRHHSLEERMKLFVEIMQEIL